MRGIPSSALMIFFSFVFVVELLSYFGIRKILSLASEKIRQYITIVYFIISITTTGLLLYSFSSPEIIRQSRNYNFFYFVISVTFLNLFPKCVFGIMTFLSYLIRWIINRHWQMLVLTGSLIISTGTILILNYGIFVGRYDIYVVKQNLHLNNLPEQLDGLKIIQISDIHLGSYVKNLKAIKETVKIIEELHPDILLFTGDIVNNFGKEMTEFEPYLIQLSAKYGKYAISGNHDYGDYFNWPDSVSKRQNRDQIKKGLASSGFMLLQNQWVKIAIKDTSFSLIGVENWGHPPFPQYADLEAAMKGIPNKSFKILMSHDPAHWKAKVVSQTDIPLTLSGHTHGGQFGIKIAGIEFSPIYWHEKNWGGLYQSDNQFLYVNRGLGTVGFTGRMDMRPEITLLTLYKSKSH